MNFFDDLSQYGDSVAFLTENGELITYAKLLQDADKIAENAESRSLVLCVCQNSIEAVTGYIGFLRARIVPLLVGSSLNPALFHKLLQLYQPHYIWMPDQLYGADLGAKIHRLGQYVLLKTHHSIDYTLNKDLALLLTTSGSTGSPKLVRLSYKNIISNARAIASYLNITDKDKPITTLPMNYTYGLSILHSHLLKGATVILTMRGLMDKVFWNLLRDHEATTFGGVPYTYEMLDKLRFERMNLPSLRILTQAGGKLAQELARKTAMKCNDKGITFITMYGQTEATARMSYLPGDYSIEKAGSIGFPIPGGQFWLRDGDGHFISTPNVAGELVYEGENVSMGYALSCYDLYKGDENQGILRTGDIAQRDPEGFYYIVGRMNRYIKMFGVRVNIDEIEALLKTAGYNCVCTGEDDSLRVYTTEQEKQDDIRKFIASVTNFNPLGFKVLHIDAIPYNEAGKIIYSALNQRVLRK